MRCTAAQVIGPPSSVKAPQTAKKYSMPVGSLYDRCVCKRWYPMLMPRPVVTQYKKTVTAKTFQLKKNSPAIAPTCRKDITMQLAQLILSSGDFPNSFVITVAPGG